MAYPYVHDKEVRILSKHFGEPAARSVQGWRERGGWKALEKALAMKPEEIVALIKDSGLRGRGGAGFPTGVKWSFFKDDGKPHYLLINADESEPGAFKDRELCRWTPQQLIEGALICAYAIRAQHIYIYIRGEFFEPAMILGRAVEECYEQGIVGKDLKIDITVHLGAGAYICGEETALMNSLEGRRGQPRIKPPYPAVVGAFGMPTNVNNVETLCCVPHIVNNGAAWYKSMGTEKSPGTKLFNVSGHVVRRGNFELPLGFPLMDLINDVCGGIRDGRTLKAVIPGGSSVPILHADECNINLDYESVAAAGTMLGTASVIVMDDQTCMVKAVRRMVDFYAHESCGQCTPCREGTAWLAKILRRIEEGFGSEEDLDALLDIGKNMSGTTICVLSDSAAAPTASSIQKFRDEYIAHIRDGVCPFDKHDLAPTHPEPEVEIVH